MGIQFVHRSVVMKTKLMPVPHSDTSWCVTEQQCSVGRYAVHILHLHCKAEHYGVAFCSSSTERQDDPSQIFNTYPDWVRFVTERCSYTIEQYAVGGGGMWALSPPFYHKLKLIVSLRCKSTPLGCKSATKRLLDGVN